MSDLIDRQAAVDLVTDMEFMNNTAKGILRDRLRKLPFAQLELKKGKWLHKSKQLAALNTAWWYECSICGYHAFNGMRTDFCPNCGADMRERRTDE